MKKCARCKEEKPMEAFCINRRTKDGRHCYCRACMAEKQRAIPRERAQSYQNKWRSKNGEKVRAKDRARYAANPERGRETAKRWRDLHREQLAASWKARRRSVTLKQYGLTLQEYDRLLVDQGGKCAICSSGDPQHWSGQFQIDHDHQTGAVRGLLCAPCNGGLGLLGDTPQRLQAALDYLKRTAQIAAAGFYRAS